jgi:hypothetical protein
VVQEVKADLVDLEDKEEADHLRPQVVEGQKVEGVVKVVVGQASLLDLRQKTS